jgi:transposase-like protein
MPKPPTATETTEIVADPANDKRQRRRRSTQEKLRILAEADRCEGRGGVSALLRREGIYSSHLTTWRKQLRSGGEIALQAKAPGRKPTRDERDRMIEKLEREKAQLAKTLLIAEKVIELQGKAHEILGIALPRVEDGEKR